MPLTKNGNSVVITYVGIVGLILSVRFWLDFSFYVKLSARGRRGQKEMKEDNREIFAL